MEENKNATNFPYDPNGVIAHEVKGTPQKSVIDEMVKATTDPASMPVTGAGDSSEPNQTDAQAVPPNEPPWTHDEDGLPVQNGYTILARPRRLPAGKTDIPPWDTREPEPTAEDGCHPMPGPKEGKEYGSPTWEWWRNYKGTWGATATFTSTDGEDVQRVDAPMIHYEKVDGGIQYRAEVDFGTKTIYSDPYFVANPPKENDEENPNAGRGTTSTSGSYSMDGARVSDEEEKPEESKPLIEDPENPLNEVTEKQIKQMLQQAQEMVRIMESQWTASRKEFELTDSHMKLLYKFNEDNREPMPDDLSDEEKDKWDHFNGLNKLTEEDVIDIFGEGHKIIGVEHSVTLDRIRDVVNDFFSWTYAMREYRNIHDAYLQLIEIEEENNIHQLEAIAEKEEDPEKKKAMENAIHHYYYMKNLGFLEDVLEDGAKKRLADAWADEKRIDYWIKRSLDKLRRMKISTKFILEISQFEKRFLDEKYHRVSNILLTYFLNIATYSKPDEKTNENRTKVVCMVFALDAFIQNRMSEEKKQDLLKKILAFEDQMLEYIPEQEVAN